MNFTVRIKKILIPCLFLLAVFFTTASSYAYWALSIDGSSRDLDALISIGNWIHNGNLPQGVIPYVPNTGYEKGMLCYEKVGVIVLLVKLLIKKPKEEHKDMKKESDEDEISS